VILERSDTHICDLVAVCKIELAELERGEMGEEEVIDVVGVLGRKIELRLRELVGQQLRAVSKCTVVRFYAQRRTSEWCSLKRSARRARQRSQKDHHCARTWNRVQTWLTLRTISTKGRKRKTSSSKSSYKSSIVRLIAIVVFDLIYGLK
jgi:hypothetical protein